MSKSSNYTICTAIPYLNGNPHLGHVMDYLLADVFARFYNLQGRDVVVTAGTDEHGAKIYQKALTSGLAVQDFVDAKAQVFQDFIHGLGVNYTHFTRTSSPKHCELCQAIWRKLSPHIYKGSYEGFYCEGCEAFITQKEFDHNHGICPDHKKSYTRLKESNYYLRISDFKPKIIAAIESGQMQILPLHRKKEILNLFKDMPDVSISRPREQVSWGIEVPDDPSQIMYVWIDALSNYLTAFSYPEQSNISPFWPADLQIVGKDILRFHAGIWPAMLLGLGLELPKTLFTHGFISLNGEKMSKSTGNIVDPRAVIDKYGVEAFRFYFLHQVSSFEDSDFSWDKFEVAYNDLANTLGNLVQRVANLCAKNTVPGATYQPVFDDDFVHFLEEFQTNSAFDYIWSKIQNLNKQIDREQPWALAKTQPAAAKDLLVGYTKDLLNIAYHLRVFLPDTAAAIERIFSAPTIVTPSTPLFPKNL